MKIRVGGGEPDSGRGRCARTGSAGFSLVEMLIVIMVIGVLTAIALSVISHVKDEARVAGTAMNLKRFETAFKSFLAWSGSYPPDTHNALPVGGGMEKFLPADSFEQDTPMGGRYNWEGPDFYPYAGISLMDVTAETSLIRDVDALVDDGNLSTGKFRVTANGRYTYIIDESP